MTTQTQEISCFIFNDQIGSKPLSYVNKPQISLKGYHYNLLLHKRDVTFCIDGPILMELNTEPNLEVPQMLSEQPLIDDRLMTILKRHGW